MKSINKTLKSVSLLGTLLFSGSFLQSVHAEALPSAGLMPLIDTHIHYSHDAVYSTPPKKAIEILREAGLQKAFVSSSSDKGTQLLYAEAPDLIVPVLRPYRKRGETSTWLHDETVPAMLEELLANNTYAGIGEFHVYGKDANLPVIRRTVELASEYGIFLHLHGDSDAVEYVFEQDKDARILWAHSGFDNPEDVAVMLEKYPNLTADLAFRTSHAYRGKVDEDWRKLFLAYPDRIMIGTDTYTPERWYYVVDHAEWSRTWLADLPTDVAEQIGYKNAQNLAAWALK
ncbi:amidohydrolase family protein [Marinomonas sp. C2222]|uniref:Amidohydrolase family protein n=1 Tax=Marinomonas sargassi TaxID=2984494 RepID=A0ABT2YUR2_9GAMM|nr:amidohydrolase family protein [Marinomonas sargassi]MCV2403624.1 amidohydrolase family protein [Marinomonas sargassi]